MKHQPVKLHITGTQFTDPDQTVSDFFVEGKMNNENGELYLEYPEPGEHGLGEVTTVLRYDGKLLKLERDGESGLLIEKGRRHICQYHTPLGDVYIGVNGGDIKVTDSPDRLDMEIDYAIDINTSLASRNNIKIKAQRL
mgnify:CR=1 FL=1